MTHFLCQTSNNSCRQYNQSPHETLICKTSDSRYRQYIANHNDMSNVSVKPQTVMVKSIIIWLNTTTRTTPLSNLNLEELVQCSSCPISVTCVTNHVVSHEVEKNEIVTVEHICGSMT